MVFVFVLSGNNEVWETIPVLFASEQSFDHLYGVSWVQLVFIYVVRPWTASATFIAHPTIFMI